MDTKKIVHHPVTRNSLCNPLVALAYVLSCVERWHIFGEGHSRTLRHDWHGYPSLQWYELSQDFPPWTLIFWVAFDLFYVLCTFILNPEVHTSFERLLGRPGFPFFTSS